MEDLTSPIVKLAGDGRSGAQRRLLADTAVAVRHTLGTGSEEDNRELDALERAVWLELALCCPDRREREHLLEQALGRIAPPGVPSCRRAARLLIRTGGWLARAGGGVTSDERARMGGCAEQCARGAVRLERIALELEGSRRLARAGERSR